MFFVFVLVMLESWMTATYDSRGALLDRCGGDELVRWNRRYVERMEELWERKCLLGLVGERLLSKNPIFHEKKIYICGEQFLLGELFLHTLTICRTEDVYIHTSSAI